MRPSGNPWIRAKGTPYPRKIAQAYTLSIEGHTDDVGSKEHNLELSERRAASVRDYLVEQGVPAESVSARGFGESQPMARTRPPPAERRTGEWRSS
jgi:outer membrane protein OmpA-like peptidoglycan-associated protein